MCVYMCRDRATAEECLQHPWLQCSSEPQNTKTVEELLPSKDQEASTGSSSSGGDHQPPASNSISGEKVEEAQRAGEEPCPSEELIVVAAYTLGQCRQSSTSNTKETEALAAQQKAISKRFKFEEPFSALQEVPGEFIY